MTDFRGASVRAICVVVSAMAFAAQADDADHTFFSDDGDEYAARFSEHGAVLTSVYPKAWAHLEPSEDHTVDRKHAIIFFGKDCDATHNQYGKGRWAQANGAFNAEFEKTKLYFNRQELWGLNGELSDVCAILAWDDDWPGNQPDPKTRRNTTDPGMP